MTAATPSFPRLPLTAIILLITVTLAGVTAARVAGVSPHVVIHTGEPVQTRLLRFEDRKDGSVAVIDAKTSADIAIAQPGTNGFLRGTLRGLMRTRKLREINRTEPFRLERYATGQLVLVDTIVNKDISLDAFGPTNAAVFAAFLSTPEGDRK
jgi:putative photosynthetic complex assembly protein